MQFEASDKHYEREVLDIDTETKTEDEVRKQAKKIESRPGITQ